MKSGLSLVIGGTAAGLLAFACIGTASAAKINACVNITNGQLRVVAAGAPCKNGEEPLQWDQTATPSGGSSAVWKDANGQVIGRAIGDHHVEINANGVKIAATVTRIIGPNGRSLGEGNGWLQGYLYFSGANCTGTAVIEGSWSNVGRISTIMGSTLMIAAATEAASTPVRSFQYFDEYTNAPVCYDFGYLSGVDGLPVAATYELGGFVAPFAYY